MPFRSRLKVAFRALMTFLFQVLPSETGSPFSISYSNCFPSTGQCWRSGREQASTRCFSQESCRVFYGSQVTGKRTWQGFKPGFLHEGQ